MRNKSNLLLENENLKMKIKIEKIKNRKLVMENDTQKATEWRKRIKAVDYDNDSIEYFKTFDEAIESCGGKDIELYLDHVALNDMGMEIVDKTESIMIGNCLDPLDKDDYFIAYDQLS